MQEFEKPRYEEAIVNLLRAFQAGYALGQQQLLAGASDRLAEVGDHFEIRVPKDAVLDGVWQGWRLVFEEHGRRAALAVQRSKEPDVHGPIYEWSTGYLVWTVALGR